MASQLEIHNELAEFAANGSTRKPGVVVHPLDPLSAAELEKAVGVLQREKQLHGDVRIVSINLTEPAKAVVEQYQPGSPFERKALAVLVDRTKRASYEVTVDLLGDAVDSVKALPATYSLLSCSMSLVSVSKLCGARLFSGGASKARCDRRRSRDGGTMVRRHVRHRVAGRSGRA